MDRMPGGGGGPPDGAFERFLTAALATIITIMFSWRLLHEENEASGCSDRDSTPSLTSADFQYHTKARSRYKKLSERRSGTDPSPAGGHYDISLDELDYSDSENSVNISNISNMSVTENNSVREKVTTDSFDPVTAPPLGASPPSINQTTDMSSGHSNLDFPASSADTLTTWDDYDWQEDTGHEQEYVIKTRRSVRNFAKNPKVNPLRNIETNYTETSFESDITPVVNSQVQAEARTHPAAAGNQQFLSLSQRLASFEYSDTGGDSGYVDLYPDVDTDDDDESEEESSDEEHEYEIQISDSDSDSPDERSSSFYGVNTLDTIFEEFESDIEDDIICDTDRDGDICDKGGSNSDKGPFGDETGRYEPDIPLDRESRLDNACGKDKHDAKQTSVNVNDSLTPSGTFLGDLRKQPVQENIQQAVSSARTETSPSNITLNLNPVDEITKHDTLHTVDRDLPTRAETSEYNVSPDFLPVAGDETILNRNVNLDRTENTDSIDLTVNNTGSLNSGIFHKNPLKDKSVIGDLSHITSQDRVSEINVKQRDTENSASRHNASSPSTLQIEFSKLQERMKVPRLDQLQKDHPSTDSSEDNSPSSPVRNIAIDNLADDRFSDTESCSSESVITVISVKSNESDYYPGERGDLTRDSCATPVRTSVDLTAGDRDPLVRTNMSDSSYEHTSLVSGFLNDSLNSLLSANNINDLEGETDVDISKIERQNSSPELTLLEKVEPKLLPGENQQVADDVSEQSESSSKTSSADSLSIELARVQETNQINTELSNQAANSMAADEFRIESRISDALISHDLRILDENDMADRFIGSDSSSDSSDPPLREYDPDDDDLAAFQFNQDCDNDSFYLLVGDEGCLRNYETFTNLDSIGLSSEYNDAFTSRAFPDEASSFTFSRTEDLGTQFRTQTYFTDRRNMSDTDSHSDKGLSPIASDDDEEITCLPEPDPSPVILPLRSEQSEHATTGEKSKIDLLDKYRDAALSQAHDGGVTGTPFTDSLDGNEKKSIDFQKYIIQPERKQDAIKNVDQGGPDSQIGDKDPVGKIDEDFIETKGGEIDNDQCALNISGVNTLNNTVGTNNSRVPQNSSTETADSLLANRDTVKIETDIDSDILCVETDPIKGPCDDYVSDNDAEKVANNDRSVDLISSYISEKRASDRSSKQGRVETNVDELFTESDEKGNGVEAIHKPGKSIQFKKSGRVKLVNRVSKETTIDDFSFVKSDNSSVETNIDEAVPENNVSQLSNEISSRITCETNVDDLFKQPVKSDTPSRLEKGKVNKSRETNIDDIWDDKPTTVNYGEKVSREPVDLTPSKCLIETNVDDIFIDDVIPVKVCPVQSTPMKYAHSLETNVDDVISDKTTHVDEKHTSHRKSVETYVDDLFGDVGLNQEDDVETSSTYAKQENRDASKSNVNKQLSYETFVDDLFSEVLSTEDSCSSLSVDTNVQSSQRAIDGVILSEYTETSTAKEVPISVQTVYSNQHSKSDEFKHPKQIERGVGSDKITDPNRFGQKSLSLKDNSPLDYNSDSEDLNVTNSVYGEDCQNTLPIQQVPSTAKLIDRKIELPDCIEPQICTNAIRDIHSIPTPYGQNNVNSIDTISDGNNVITTENNTNNNVTSLKSKVEEEKAINEHVNNEQLSLECNYDNLKGHKELPVIDHNANVSLPKAGGLNIVRNSDNSSDLGLYPGELNRGARTSPPISVEPTGKRLTLPEVETTAIDSSHDINYGITNDGDIALKIVEDSDSVSVTKSGNTSFEQETFSSIGSCSLNSDDESLSSIEESYHTLQSTYNTARLRGLSDSAIARVVRDHAVKPSVIFRKSKEYQGVKRRVHKHQLKKYSSILQQPIPTEANQGQLPDLLSPEKPLSVNRLKVLQSRQRFLSAENLNTSNSSFEDRFLQYRTSLTSTTPRKYLKRHERALPEMQSTESLPADMSALDFMNSSYGSCSSMDRVHSLPVSHQIEELYQSRYSSTNSSFERHEIDKLHANCMFSPAKREEIRHTTKSLENMFEQLLRYGSVSSSLAETDLDVEVLAQESSFPPDIDISDYVSFQYPLERAASMSALIGPSEGHRLPRKPNKGRFASRNVPKSKSLQTLETNLDDVFAAEVDEFSGELKKVPSVHELRVSNSLSKLNVPDWFRKSSFSRSGSTQSLFTYASRQGSTSTLGSSIYPASITTSPSPSVTPGSNTVIITKRVTATPSTPSTARLIRAPLLPTTPERAPIHNTPSTMSLPSDRFRKNEKKELKPIAIVPFAKLREMFEKKAQENAHSKSKSTPVSSPVRENPPSKVRFESASSVQSRNVTVQSPVRRETTIDNEPVQINRTVSPVPQLPERKPILADSSRRTESAPSNGQPPRKMQVHFSDEKQHVEHKNEEKQWKAAQTKDAM